MDSNGRGGFKGEWRAEIGRCHEWRGGDGACTWWGDGWRSGRGGRLCGWVGGGRGGLRLLQTLLKWPTFLHRWHVALGGAALATPFMEARNAVRARPTRLGSMSPEGLDVHGLVLVISARCFLAAS